MDPKPTLSYMAPGAGVAHSYSLPGPHEFPRVDDHLVRPETREEMVRGTRVLAVPAHPPHAERQTKLDVVIDTHVAPGYVAATDLLTRVGPRSDFATDLCVRKVGIDPDTGARYLEELAFEIVSEQSRRSIMIRAEDLCARGVRRLIAIFVKTSTIEEWNRDTQRFEPLDLDGELVDPTLTRPLALRALLDGAKGYDETARALDLKGVPYLAQLRREAELRGEQKLLIRQLEHRFGPLSDADRIRLAQADAAQLERWSERVLDAATLDDVLR
jgi:hypothetical protein